VPITLLPFPLEFYMSISLLLSCNSIVIDGILTVKAEDFNRAVGTDSVPFLLGYLAGNPAVHHDAQPYDKFNMAVAIAQTKALGCSALIYEA